VSLGLIILAFLFGSVPSGVVLSRAFLGRDVRDIGSGNIGAANAARAGGLKLGAAVALLDVVKGLVPVLLGRWVGLDPMALSLVAVAAVLGHDFSLFLRFRGGKGVATTLGVVLGLAPAAGVLAVFAWVIVLVVWRYTSLASLVALALLPLLLLLTGQPGIFLVAALALFVLGAAKHVENIGRLMSGTERRFGLRPADGA
jgi:glycerol-3-phosphate acyltransferase PlsY